MLCYLALSIHTQKCIKCRDMEFMCMCQHMLPCNQRTNDNITHVSHTCEHVDCTLRLTRANPYVWYNALQPCKPCHVCNSHALSHLHYAPLGASAQLAHIYTVMLWLPINGKIQSQTHFGFIYPSEVPHEPQPIFLGYLNIKWNVDGDIIFRISNNENRWRR